MEVLGPGVELELQLLTYTTATAVPDPSCICDLCHSLWQCQILNPLSGARDWVRIFIDTSQFLSWWATTVPTLFFTLAFQAVQLILSLTSLLYLLFFFLFKATAVAYGNSWPRGQIGTAAACLWHSHSNTASKPHLRLMLQLAATPDFKPLSKAWDRMHIHTDTMSGSEPAQP